MTRTLLALSIAGALAVAGCGSSNDNGSSSSSSTSSTTSSSSGAATGGRGRTVKIDMKNIAFDPRDVTVKVGTKVEWVNQDTVDHNVKADSGASFASDNFGKGGTYAFTPTKPGKIAYECTIHPGMTGTLTVTK